MADQPNTNNYQANLDIFSATLQELADEYGVSAERIRQIEANAFKKIRALFVA